VGKKWKERSLGRGKVQRKKISKKQTEEVERIR
jgi:hypothetical protein